MSWLRTPRAAYLIGEPLFWLLGMRRNRQKIDLLQAKRVLVVRLDEIGDVVMTTPFLRELRGNLPDAWITLVVKPAVYNLMELCPYVNEVLTYDWNTPGRFANLRRHGRALKLAWHHLWRRRFDLAILPRWDADHYHAAFVTYFSGAPWRLGYSEDVNEHKRKVNDGLNRLFTHVLNSDGLKHEVERSLDLLRFLGGTVENERLELWVESEEKRFVQEVLNSYKIQSGELLVAFGRGAGHPKRMWPIDNFIKLGRWLVDEWRARILVVGGPGDEYLGQALRRALGEGVTDMAGRTTLRQTGALLKQCYLFVGNDAGPMHLAAAAGLPVVEISCHPRSGLPSYYNSPARFGPWGVPSRVLQPERPLPPCSEGCEARRAHCITQIGVEQVKEAVRALLACPTDQKTPQRVRK